MKGSTTSTTFIEFLDMLVAELDDSNRNWRESIVLVFDNAQIHKSILTRQWLNQNRIPFLYTGVASFLALPVERVFARVK